METFVNRRQNRSSSLNSNPQWIENVLLKLQATERIQDSVEESFGLVQAVVNILLSAVANYDAKFSFHPVDSSSFFVAKAANHFELLVFLSSSCLRPGDVRFQGDMACPGLAVIELSKNTNSHRTWKNLCWTSKSGKDYLSSKMFRSELSRLLSKLLEDMSYLQNYHNRTMEGIEIKNLSNEDICLEVNIRGLNLIVNLVAAIDFEGVWPGSDEVSIVGEKSCKHISNTRSKRKPVNCGVQLVSKSTPKEYHWKIWFCKAERLELNFNRFSQRQKCFQLLKTFVYSELGCDFIKLYHLQTVLLYESAKFPDESQWMLEKLPERFCGLINLLQSFVNDKCCPHFFIPSLNLFTALSSQHQRIFRQRVKFLKDSYGNFIDNRFPEQDINTFSTRSHFYSVQR
ncbi:hypothetical protein ABFA07_004105 [Porites harrisoni]